MGFQTQTGTSKQINAVVVSLFEVAGLATAFSVSSGINDIYCLQHLIRPVQSLSSAMLIQA